MKKLAIACALVAFTAAPAVAMHHEGMEKMDMKGKSGMMTGPLGKVMVMKDGAMIMMGKDGTMMMMDRLGNWMMLDKQGMAHKLMADGKMMLLKPTDAKMMADMKTMMMKDEKGPM